MKLPNIPALLALAIILVPAVLSLDDGGDELCFEQFEWVRVAENLEQTVAA